jgi:HK97 family phage major capsid protein
MSDKAKALELRGQRAQLIKDAQKILSDNPKGLTPEQRTQFDKMFADADLLKADIDRHERSAALQAEIDGPAGPGAGDPDPKQFRKEAPIGDGKELEEKRVTTAVQEYRTAYRRARPGQDPLGNLRPETRSVIDALNEKYWDAMKAQLASWARRDSLDNAEQRAILAGAKPEYRDMGIATSALGGFLVPQGFVFDIEQALKFYGDMVNEGVVSMLNTATGNPMPYPTDNDTTNTGELIGEAAQVTETDVTIGSITFGAYKYSTKMVKLSIELLQDAGFDLESYLKAKFATRLGRILNTHFTVGTGSAQPNGVLTAATAGPTAVGSATNTGGAETGGTTIGSKDFTELEHSVDKAYRVGARYMMHDSVLKLVKEVLDKYGRPLFQPGMTVGAPDTINGYPYSINNDLPVMALNAKTVLFGQFSKYTVRRVRELAIVKLSERYADYGQVAFIGFARYDGQLMDAGTHPVKYLVQAAS